MSTSSMEEDEQPVKIRRSARVKTSRYENLSGNRMDLDGDDDSNGVDSDEEDDYDGMDLDEENEDDLEHQKDTSKSSGGKQASSSRPFKKAKTSHHPSIPIQVGSSSALPPSTSIDNVHGEFTIDYLKPEWVEPFAAFLERNFDRIISNPPLVSPLISSIQTLPSLDIGQNGEKSYKFKAKVGINDEVKEVAKQLEPVIKLRPDQYRTTYQSLLCLEEERRSILGDEMGFGKTITAIVVGLARMRKSRKEEAQRKGKGKESDREVPDGMLIIVPFSMVTHWKGNLDLVCPVTGSTYSIFECDGFAKFDESDFVIASESELEKASEKSKKWKEAGSDQLGDPQGFRAHYFYTKAWEMKCFDEAFQSSGNLVFKHKRKLKAATILLLSATLYKDVTLTDGGGILGNLKLISGLLHYSAYGDFDTLSDEEKINLSNHIISKLSTSGRTQDLDEDRQPLVKLPNHVYGEIIVPLSSQELRKVKGSEHGQMIHSLVFTKLNSKGLALTSAVVSTLKEPRTKIVVFLRSLSAATEFKSVLKKKFDIDASIFNGKYGDREKELQNFTLGRTRIILVSMKVGSVGLDMSSATHIFLYDSFWSQADLLQAVGRVIRNGCDPEVVIKIYRFVTDTKFDSNIWRFAERKGMRIAVNLKRLAAKMGVTK